jgi:ATP-binding cassette, subfamily B, bacterial
MSHLQDSARHIRQAVRLVVESARGWTLLQAALVAVQGALPVAALLLTRRTVDAVGAYLAQAPGARDVRPLALLLPWVAAVAVVGWLARALSTLVAEAQAEAVTDRVQEDLQKKSVEVDLEYYETPAYYDQMRLAQSEAAPRATSIVRNLTQLAGGGLVLGSVVGVLGASQGLLLPILLLAALPGAVARIVHSRQWNRWKVGQSAASRYVGYLHALVTALPFAKEIRLNGSGAELRHRHRDLRRTLRRSRLSLLRRRTLVELAADAASAAAMVAGLGIIYLRMKGGAMTLGDLALLYGGFQKGKAAFSGVLGSLTALYEDSLFIAHLYTFLGLPRRVLSPTHPQPVPRRITQGIRLEQVSFRYPGTDRDVLTDVDLELKAGEHVALVGENGSGKTTLVKLLCRLYDPTRGRILVDGTDIREFALDDYRASISVLFQDFVRYQMTAGENIRMGDVAVPPGDPRLADAARLAGAESVIQRLPAGYETPLGRLFAGGAELSEGQWQRMALARAFLRQAPIVMLDEPTSALDARAERLLLESVMSILDGRTALVVSHRFTTVQAADRIWMLAEGRVVEAGTHDDLVRANGAYAHLFSLHRPDPGA